MASFLSKRLIMEDIIAKIIFLTILFCIGLYFSIELALEFKKAISLKDSIFYRIFVAIVFGIIAFATIFNGYMLGHFANVFILFGV